MRRKNRLENSIQFIHGMREGFSKWGCQKVFKELHTHTKNLFSYLNPSSMENNIMAFKLHSLCWG